MTEIDIGSGETYTTPTDAINAIGGAITLDDDLILIEQDGAEYTSAAASADHSNPSSYTVRLTTLVGHDGTKTGTTGASWEPSTDPGSGTGYHTLDMSAPYFCVEGWTFISGYRGSVYLREDYCGVRQCRFLGSNGTSDTASDLEVRNGNYADVLHNVFYDSYVYIRTSCDYLAFCGNSIHANHSTTAVSMIGAPTGGIFRGNRAHNAGSGDAYDETDLESLDCDENDGTDSSTPDAGSNGNVASIDWKTVVQNLNPGEECLLLVASREWAASLLFGSACEVSSAWTQAGTGISFSSWAAARGNYGIEVDIDDISSRVVYRDDVPSGQTVIYLSFALKLASDFSMGTAELFASSLLSNGGTYKVRLNIHENAGAIEVRLQTAAIGSSGYYTLTKGTSHVISLVYTIDSSGSLIATVDGNSWANLSGDNSGETIDRLYALGLSLLDSGTSGKIGVDHFQWCSASHIFPDDSTTPYGATADGVHDGWSTTGLTTRTWWVAEDALGNARSDFDVGAFEFVAASPPASGGPVMAVCVVG